MIKRCPKLSGVVVAAVSRQSLSRKPAPCPTLKRDASRLAANHLLTAQKSAHRVRHRVSGMLMGAGSILVVTGMGFFVIDQRQNQSYPGSVWPLVPGGYLLLLGVLPTDRRAVFSLIMLCFCGSLVMFGVFVNRTFHFLDHESDCKDAPSVAECVDTVWWVVAAAIAAVVAISLLPTLRAYSRPAGIPSRRALHRLWAVARATTAMYSAAFVATSVVRHQTAEAYYQRDGYRRYGSRHDDLIGAVVMSSVWLTCSAALNYAVRRHIAHALTRLGSRGEAARSAAVAGLVGGLDPQRALEVAQQRFRSIDFRQLQVEDFMRNAPAPSPSPQRQSVASPNKRVSARGGGGICSISFSPRASQRMRQASRNSSHSGSHSGSNSGRSGRLNAQPLQPRDLSQLAVPAKFGDEVVFLSHSWHDDGPSKFGKLMEWATAYERIMGASPKLWLDKACIDQQNISENLASLPCFLAGCSSLLVVCGPTYLTRLWCLLELYTYVFMGGAMDRVTVLPLCQTWDETRAQFSSFDVQHASCHLADERDRLLGVIEAGFGDTATFSKILQTTFNEQVLAAANSDRFFSRKASLCAAPTELSAVPRNTGPWGLLSSIVCSCPAVDERASAEETSTPRRGSRAKTPQSSRRSRRTEAWRHLSLLARSVGCSGTPRTSANSSHTTARESASHSTDSRSTAGERSTAGPRSRGVSAAFSARRSAALRGNKTPRGSADAEGRHSPSPSPDDAPPSDRCSVTSLSRSSGGGGFVKAPRRGSAIARVRALTRTMMLGSRRSCCHHASAATLASTVGVVGATATATCTSVEEGRGSESTSSQGVGVAAERESCGPSASARPAPARGSVVSASGSLSVGLPQRVLVTLDSASDQVALPIARDTHAHSGVSLASGRNTD